MFLKIILVLALVLIVFFAYVSTRPSHFRYERSGLIQASAEKIYPFFSDLKKGGLWSPYEQKDPALQKTFTGPVDQVGGRMDFAGNAEAGTGSIEILKLVPNQSAELKLIMLKPIRAENQIVYTLTPEGTGTRMSWAMSGESGFLGKLIGVLIDCEKMVTQDFVKGIENLKNLAEAQK